MTHPDFNVPAGFNEIARRVSVTHAIAADVTRLNQLDQCELHSLLMVEASHVAESLANGEDVHSSALRRVASYAAALLDREAEMEQAA